MGREKAETSERDPEVGGSEKQRDGRKNRMEQRVRVYALLSFEEIYNSNESGRCIRYSFCLRVTNYKFGEVS